MTVHCAVAHVLSRFALVVLYHRRVISVLGDKARPLNDMRLYSYNEFNYMMAVTYVTAMKPLKKPILLELAKLASIYTITAAMKIIPALPGLCLDLGPGTTTLSLC